MSLVIVIAIAIGIGIIVLAIGLICMRGYVLSLYLTLIIHESSVLNLFPVSCIIFEVKSPINSIMYNIYIERESSIISTHVYSLLECFSEVAL